MNTETETETVERPELPAMERTRIKVVRGMLRALLTEMRDLTEESQAAIFEADAAVLVEDWHRRADERHAGTVDAPPPERVKTMDADADPPPAPVP